MSYKDQPRHQPWRFNEFKENIDGTGFVVEEKGKEIEFFYDNLHGWFDEYGNYYDKNGKPLWGKNVPLESLKFWDKIKYHYEEDDEDDDLLREYEQEMNGGHSSDDDHIDGNSDDELEQIIRENNIVSKTHTQISRNQSKPTQFQQQPQFTNSSNTQPKQQQQPQKVEPVTQKVQQPQQKAQQQPVKVEQQPQKVEEPVQKVETLPVQPPQNKNVVAEPKQQDGAKKFQVELTDFKVSTKNEEIQKWIHSKSGFVVDNLRSKDIPKTETKMVRFDFKESAEREEFWKAFTKDVKQGGKIMYKGSYAIKAKLID